MRRLSSIVMAVAAMAAAAVLGCSLLVGTSGLAGGPSAADAAPSTGARDADVSDADAPRVDADGRADAPLSVADTYAAAVLADGPALYLRLDETSGSVALDATGVQNAAYFGEVALGTQGAFPGSKAISLSGLTGGIDAGPRFDFEGRKPMTLEAWYRVTKTDGVYRFLFGKDATDAKGREEYGLFFQVPDGFYFERYVHEASQAVYMTPLAQDGSYHHVVVTYDGSTVFVWVDGIVAGSLNDTRNAATKGGVSFCIGALSPKYGTLFGDVDDAAVYEKALTPDRILAHYHAAGR